MLGLVVGEGRVWGLGGDEVRGGEWVGLGWVGLGWVGTVVVGVGVGVSKRRGAEEWVRLLFRLY